MYIIWVLGIQKLKSIVLNISKAPAVQSGDKFLDEQTAKFETFIVYHMLEEESQEKTKDLGNIFWGRPKSLPADLKSTVCELAQNRAQIFGVPEGTLYAHEISFVKSCTVRSLDVAKVW